jgi:hypothetical protein
MALVRYLSTCVDIDRGIDARLTRSPQIRKCSRSPLHRAAASPLQQLRTLFGVVSPEDVLESIGPRRSLEVIAS